MRGQALPLALALSGLIGCSGNSPVRTGPSPDADVVGTASGTVVTTGARSTAASLRIPPGHLPAPGTCRVWEPGRPPGQQRHLPSGGCDEVERLVRPGQWLVYRPGEHKRIVEVKSYEASRAGGVVVRLTRVFDVATGILIREVSGP